MSVVVKKTLTLKEAQGCVDGDRGIIEWMDQIWSEFPCPLGLPSCMFGSLHSLVSCQLLMHEGSAARLDTRILQHGPRLSATIHEVSP